MSTTAQGKNLIITSGDPGGIGAEVILKALEKFPVPENWTFWILGDAWYYSWLSKKLGIAQSWKCYKKDGSLSFNKSHGIVLIDFGNVSKIVPGKTGEDNGRASMEYLFFALELYRKGKLDALVTAPICKKSLWLSGFKYAGHTHFLARETRTKYVTMSMLSKGLKVFFVTDHIPFRAIISRITYMKIIKTIQRAEDCLKQLGYARIKMGICSLNPHAGEDGIFGHEEEIICRARDYWQANGLSISGPFPPEICFRNALNGYFNGVVAMYHDQGMIPFKIISKGNGINVTLGLPFIRVSPEHGTAFDIAEQYIADETSMLNALRFAVTSRL